MSASQQRKLRFALGHLSINSGDAVKYAESLIQNGWTDPDDLLRLTEEQWAQCGVKKGHRTQIIAGLQLRAAEQLQSQLPEEVSDAAPDPDPAADMDDLPSAEFAVTAEEEGQRLDQMLAARFPDQSRTYFGVLCGAGHVWVSGRAAKKKVAVRQGEVVKVVFAMNNEMRLTPEDIPLDILYEDEHMIVINKQSNMVVHPAPGNRNGTLLNALLFHFSEQVQEQLIAGGSEVRAGIVHRLDKDTTGVIVAAKTIASHRAMVKSFCERLVYKEYVGVCVGDPGDAELVINEPIGRHPTDRVKMAVVPNGKPALTRVQRLATDGKKSAIRVSIESGRTHQIRVHLQYRTMPLVGDSTYGHAEYNKRLGELPVTRPLLHAHRLEMAHPFTHQPMSFLAPIPADMALIMESLSKSMDAGVLDAMAAAATWGGGD